MDTHTDFELVDLANGGNARALEHLFDKYYMTVYSLAFKWCGVKEDAEDIAQEVFVKLVRKLHTFGQKSSFKTWLYRIVINSEHTYGNCYNPDIFHELTKSAAWQSVCPRE